MAMLKTPIAAFVLVATSLPAHAQIDIAVMPRTMQAKPSKAQIKALIDRTKSNLAYLPGGTFEMGDWGDPVSGLPYDYKSDSKPLHKVTLDSFSMMKYKVTYAEFDLFTAAKGLLKVNTREVAREYRLLDNPAGVSWFGAKAYCQWLAELTNLPFDLPTEAQWEYAARSGGKMVLFATDTGEIEKGRNFPSYEQRQSLGGHETSFIMPIGKFPSNPAGIYGMGELVREWVNDWYAPDYYQHSPVKNPKGPPSGTHKVQRGDLGSSPEFSAMVFMRSESPLRRSHEKFNDDFTSVEVPFEGFSSASNDTFRCAVQKSSRIK